MKKDIKSLPLVSVIMPVYNAGGFVADAITSILDQTYQNFELIIVNDNSTDNSLEIINTFKSLFPSKIKVVNLTRNLNVGGDAASNIAIQNATGKYIAKMDADDISHPQRLEKQVAYLEAHPELFLVGSNAHVINKEGEIVGDKTEPLSTEDIYNGYIYFHPIIHPTVMFRNNTVDKDFYQIKYPTANDYYTFFKLQCEGAKFANLEDKLLFYRIYGGNASLKNIKKGLKANMNIKLEMVTKYHYPVNIYIILKNLAIFAAGMLLPQSISYYLYLFTKGIITPKDVAARLGHKLSFPRLILALRKK